MHIHSFLVAVVGLLLMGCGGSSGPGPLASCHPLPVTGTEPARSQRATARPTDAAGWTIPPTPTYDGPLAIDLDLTGAERLAVDRLAQPEDVAFDRQGRLYTGTTDGNVWRAEVAADGRVEAFEVFAQTGGHPLGMDFDPCGNLIVAVPGRGVVAVDAAGTALTVADRVDGTRIEFADELAVAADGTVYVSDASTKYERAFPDDFLEGRPWGRVIAYEPGSGETRVVVSDLYFANGILVAPDESHLLVAETFRGRILRHWLAGDRAGQTETFADNLPVTPDNISRGPDGRIWVAGQRRTPPLDALSASAQLRGAMLRGEIPPATLPADPHALVVVLAADGTLQDGLHATDGSLPPLSTATPQGDWLWLGTNVGRGLSRVPLR